MLGQIVAGVQVEDLKAGKMIVVTDDESRENEGDLIMAGRAAGNPYIKDPQMLFSSIFSTVFCWIWGSRE